MATSSGSNSQDCRAPKKENGNNKKNKETPQAHYKISKKKKREVLVRYNKVSNTIV